MIPIRPLAGFLKDSWKHPKVRRAGWAALAAALADFMALAAFWAPAAWSHCQLERAIDADRSTRREAARTLQTAQAYSRFSSLSGDLEAKWNTPVTQAGLVESLTRSAARHHLRVLSQDFNVKSLPEGGTAFEQNLSLSGDYAAIREFLGGLEDLPCLTLVRQARLEREGTGSAEVRAVLELWTYEKTAGGA